MLPFPALPGTATTVPRPTERKALARVGEPVVPPLAAVLDLLIAARQTGDRNGAQLFGCWLDRHPEAGR